MNLTLLLAFMANYSKKWSYLLGSIYLLPLIEHEAIILLPLLGYFFFGFTACHRSFHTAGYMVCKAQQCTDFWIMKRFLITTYISICSNRNPFASQAKVVFTIEISLRVYFFYLLSHNTTLCSNYTHFSFLCLGGDGKSSLHI